MGDAFCTATTTRGTGCLQPERWLMQLLGRTPQGGPTVEQARVCQSHARMLVKAGWAPVRELHPVAGYERTAP